MPFSRRPGRRFRAQPHTRGRGTVAEDAAARWLERHGYEIVDRNVANHGGEIDVVAWNAGTLCFVEIKARASATYGPAVAAVGARKQRKIARAAALWLARHPTDAPCRFDVLGMDLGSEGWRYHLVQDAFQLPG